MKKNEIYNQNDSKIEFSDFSTFLRKLRKYSIFAIVDTNVEKYHRVSIILDKYNAKIIYVNSSEKVKNIEEIQKIISFLIDNEADKSSLIIGIGGGVVCDLTGFAASIYLRGVKFGFVPTTALAQTDAAIGGKNGVNYMKYKNMIGVINQPAFVCVDISLLQTLPRREISNGFAEIIKHALIADKALFKRLEKNYNELLKYKSNIFISVINKSINIKQYIVKKDINDCGLRKILNYGHTIGHAIESNYELSHGEAVSIGMFFSAKVSRSLNILKNRDIVRIEKVLINYGLPTEMNIEYDGVFKHIKHDKKKNCDLIDFVILSKIGKAEIKTLSINYLEQILRSL